LTARSAVIHRAGSDNRFGAGSAASIFPCRVGKLRENFFFELSAYQKISCDQRLEHEIRQQSKGWRGTGREAQTRADQPIINAIMQIHY
jgi:hypothetical protein